jgi:hypothetical protein
VNIKLIKQNFYYFRAAVILRSSKPPNPRLPMKFLSVVLLFGSLNAFADVREVRLSVKDSLQVTCQKGTVLEVSGSILKCVCPKFTFGTMVGGELKCESVCEVESEDVETPDTACDQGGCFPVRSESYKAVTVTKAGTIISRERIYSPRASELSMLLDEAMILAKKECSRVIYKGKVL